MKYLFLINVALAIYNIYSGDSLNMFLAGVSTTLAVALVLIDIDG